MEVHILQCFCFAFLCILSPNILVHAQQPSGFVNIDCGLPENTSYSDETTGLDYVSDASFIDTGEPTSKPPGINTKLRQLWRLRNFPNGNRNCYNITVAQDTKYLIRAMFLYGNYDDLNLLPVFDLYIGPNKWVTVNITNESLLWIGEIIHVPTSNYLCVCLVKTEFTVPFISALELRPLSNAPYVTQSGSLVLYNRLDVASITNHPVRYPDDVYDRIWFPFHLSNWIDINTLQNVDYQIQRNFLPPSTVMRGASIPRNSSQPIGIFIDPVNSSLQFHIYFYFAELEKLEANQSRQFNISLNGHYFDGPVTPDYLYTTVVYSTVPLPTGWNSFIIFRTESSTLPPLLNAVEVYYVAEILQSPTEQEDVDAIWKIKSTYGIRRNWQGDPCVPQAFVWDGLNCSNHGYDPPQITSLNLSSSGLTGEIPGAIANLKSLRYLDLSNNNLSGPVPDTLSQLSSLKVLNLSSNKLSGTIPVDLFRRSQDGPLHLSVSGNPELCSSASCIQKERKQFVAPVVGSIAAFVVIVSASAIIFWRLKRRKQKGSLVLGVAGDSSASKNRKFTYSDVRIITNNFDKVLGRGGFGTVYQGFLHGQQVAVKMLSESSSQGYTQFQAEVKLLLRVHHGNLTTLVGYCDDKHKKGLIYEFMANGNLEELLSGNRIELSWEERIRIALEAAQGLEYLHSGCKPPIVHRDVKTSNILLNDRLHAKIADFGLSKSFQIEDGTHVSTGVAGTFGYLDPEYYESERLTTKSDVYSCGVVLLEIITGKPAIARNSDRTHISRWVSLMLENGDIRNVVDPKLQGDFYINSTWKAVEIAMACVSTTSAERPTMHQVVTELNECLNSELTMKMEGGYAGESRNPDEIISLNLLSESTPLAR